MASWYELQLAVLIEFFKCPDPPLKNHPGHKPDDDLGAGSSVAMGKTCAVPLNCVSAGSMWKVTHCKNHTTLELNGVQILCGNYPAVQRNAAVAKVLQTLFLHTQISHRHLYTPKTYSRPYWTVLDMQPRPHFFFSYNFLYHTTFLFFYGTTLDCMTFILFFSYISSVLLLVFSTLNLGNLQLKFSHQKPQNKNAL